MDTFRDVIDEVSAARAKGEAFAVATVVRTVSLTAAKAGAKAIVRSDGNISSGWIGGGCARAAVLKAAREALADGKPRLISVQPPDALRAIGHEPGDMEDGTQYARNMCPSQGTMDVFIEPYPSRIELLVCGTTPVALALTDLAQRVGYRVVVAAEPVEHHRYTAVDELIAGFAISRPASVERYIVVATQGKGDEAALTAALSLVSRYVAFVGSHKKARALKDTLIAKGVDPRRLEELRAPAGLDLGAVTPEEIAVSILGEITTVRRRGQRQAQVPQSAATAAE
jgi:xanthine dehydrogenase accessory factor